MPSEPSRLMEAAGVRQAGKITWGAPVPDSRPGVYVIASRAGPIPEAPIDHRKVRAWMDRCPGMRLDGAAVVHPRSLVERLGRYWLPDEVILYVGLAGTSLRTRTRQFCRHVVGHNKPHAGGFWLKLLSDEVLGKVDVHWAATTTSDAAEFAMLQAFEANRIDTRDVSASQGPRLPFANLKIEVPAQVESPWGIVRRRTKDHGLSHHSIEPAARSPSNE
jgi:hypothetical protein